jgi:lipoprotein-anchoring transpeptidase ErfK/SrfK
MGRIDTLLLTLLLAPALSFGAPAKTTRTLAQEVEDATGATPVGPGAKGAEVIRAQILLDRARFSPGEIDGVYGGALQIAIRGFQEKHNLQPSGVIDAATWKLLNADGKPLLTTYTVTAVDAKGPFQPIPDDIIQQARLTRLGYESVAEKLGEKFHLSPKLLAELNPGKKLKPGERIVVPSIARAPAGPAARVSVSKSKRTVSAFNAAGKLLAQYPSTIGGRHDPLPIGSWRITIVQHNPIFYYDPQRFWNADPKHTKAKIAPGPNNPAGVVWIGLSKEHYGIHGTPDPGQIRHEESYGCIRLTNWDASDLARMVRRGTPAILEE